MRQTYMLEDAKTGIQVSVLPEYGGMISGISCKGKEILYLNESEVEASPVTAGGIPVLFPFPGKTKDDSYRLDGRTYYMPMHGLVKNSCFAVEEYKDKEIVLYMDSNAAIIQRNYPFDYRIRVRYRVEGNSVTIGADITNHSDQRMPHCIGWHPYFKTTDREKVSFRHFMDIHYNYTDEKDEETIRDIDLTKSWDDVFTSPSKAEFTLKNEGDGYEVRCVTAKEYRSLVVYTGKEGSICAEPWCGIPNSINLQRMLEWIEPRETRSYQWEMQITLL